MVSMCGCFVRWAKGIVFTRGHCFHSRALLSLEGTAFTRGHGLHSLEWEIALSGTPGTTARESVPIVGRRATPNSDPAHQKESLVLGCYGEKDFTSGGYGVSCMGAGGGPSAPISKEPLKNSPSAYSASTALLEYY
jgi:hypothetical protein